MIIEKIERKGSLMVITCDNGEMIRLPRAVMREHPLREGQRLDIDSYYQSAERSMYQKALERAVWWLSKKDHSEKQLMMKLTDSAFTEESAARACEFLKAGNYLNDARLSENLVRQKQRSSGPRKIAYTLRQKGVGEEAAKAALEAISRDDEMETAVILARKYLSGKRLEPREARQKCGAYLARRGFGWDVIKAACQRAGAEEDEEDFE